MRLDPRLSIDRLPAWSSLAGGLRLAQKQSAGPPLTMSRPASTSTMVPGAGHTVWAEEKVYVHVTAYARDNIQGRLSLSTNNSQSKSASMSLDFAVVDRAEADRISFAYPLKQLHSLRTSPPSAVRTHGSILIRTMDETPPVTLFFHDDTQNTQSWGGQRLLHALRTYVDVVSSRQDPGLHLINPSKELRALHLTPLFADNALDMAQSRPQPKNFSQWAHLTRISVLAQFSQVTRGARQSGETILSHPLIRRAARPEPSASQSNAQAGPYMVSAQQTAPSPVEFDAARVYLAKWAQQVAREGERNQIAEGPDVEALLGTTPIPPAGHAGPLHGAPPVTSEIWMSMLDGDEGVQNLAQHVFYRGITPGARPLVWPYLFGELTPSADAVRRAQEWEARVADYTQLSSEWKSPNLLLSDDVALSKHKIWIDCLRADIKDPFFESTDGAEETYQAMLQSGWERQPHQGSNAERVNHHLYVISDVLFTFCLFADRDEQLCHLHGYVQGMSDLCLVCYAACHGDAARTFWSFVGAMRRMGPNFVSDQTGMRHELLTLQRLLAELCPGLYAYLQAVDGLNLFFCFRWILVCFKREFTLPDTQRLWEAIWAASWSWANDALSIPQWPLCHNFELFVALAILECHSDVITRHLRTFDEVLQYIHSLAYQMDIHIILRRAQALVFRLRGRTQHPHTELEENLRALVVR